MKSCRCLHYSHIYRLILYNLPLNFYQKYLHQLSTSFWQTFRVHPFTLSVRFPLTVNTCWFIEGLSERLTHRTLLGWLNCRFYQRIMMEQQKDDRYSTSIQKNSSLVGQGVQNMSVMTRAAWYWEEKKRQYFFLLFSVSFCFSLILP